MNHQITSLKFKSCLCNNSIKYLIIKTLSSSNTPYIKQEFIKKIVDLIINEIDNNDLTDIEYLFVYVEKLINELVEEYQM